MNFLRETTLTHTFSGKRPAFYDIEEEIPNKSFCFSLPRAEFTRSIPDIPNWVKSKHDLCESTITINGQQMAVELVGSGSYHNVYRFLTAGSLHIGELTVSTSELALKILHPGKINPRNERKLIEKEESAYKSLVEKKIPVSKRYASPITFSDTIDPKNGKFWLDELMSEQITGSGWENQKPFEELDAEDQSSLKFAKKILTDMEAEKKDTVGDFRKRNTMINKNREIKVIDFEKSQDEKEDIMWHISRYTLDWANGNRQIFDWLISDFSQETRENFRENYKN